MLRASHHFLVQENPPRLNSKGFFYPALDGLRGIAIILVLLSHMETSRKGVPFLVGGFLGVEVFFVLSGFLITSLLVREWKIERSINLLHFYIRRARRLMPALIALQIYALIYGYFFMTSDDLRKIIRGCISSLLYYANWICAYEPAPLSILTHTWSLAVEEQFYLIFPVFLLVLLRKLSSLKQLIPMLAILVLLSSILLANYFSQGSWLRAYSGSDTRSGALLLGALTGILVECGILRSIPLYLERILVGGLIGTFMFLSHDSPLFYYGGSALFSLGVSLLIIQWISEEPTWIAKRLKKKWLCFIGKISYSLYLWHLPLAVLIADNLSSIPLWQRNVLYIALSLGVATFSYRYIERPFMKV